MSTPKVVLNVKDNQLGIRPPSAGDVIAIAGPASAGALDTPAAYTRIADVVAAHTSGPLVEAAAYAIERYGVTVVLVRTAVTGTAAAYTSVVTTFDAASDSVPTTDAGTAADDEYNVHVEFVTGGTIGVAGITYKWSLDGGHTQSPTTALGTATKLTLPEGGGIAIDFAAGDLTAGDVLTFRASPAWWSAAELGVSLDALKDTALKWSFVEIAGPIDDTAVSTIEAKLTAMETAGKLRWAIGNTRSPTLSETEAQYLTAMSTEFSATTSKRLALCSGYAKIDSSISRRRHRRPVALAVGARVAVVAPHIDLAQIDLGALPGVRLRDANGNPDEHDEVVSPGLDDLRLLTLRTDEDYPGVFVNNPRLMSPTGSDFKYIQHRRVMDIACATAKAYMKLRLSKDTEVDSDTGFIAESEAKEMEAGCNAALRAALLKPGYASAASIVLARDEAILTTETLSADIRVTPHSYPKTINLGIGFFNPAAAAA